MYCPDIACEPEIPEIFEKAFVKHSLFAQKRNVLIVKRQLAQILDKLFHPCHYRKSPAVGNLAEEHIKIRYRILHSVLKISLSHSKLIKIHEHCKVHIPFHFIHLSF